MPDPGGRLDRLSETYDRLDRRITRALARDVALPVLAARETLIGLGLLSGRFLRPTLLLLAVQMAGTVTPLVLFPDQAFSQFPLAPTLEGQYIIKNIVIIGAAMVVGATVRGGRIESEPPPPSISDGPTP